MLFNKKMFNFFFFYSFLVIAITFVTAGNDPNCGLKGPKRPSSLDPIFGSPRIIDGEDALPGEFPWQCSLRDRETLQHLCGGSLINSRFILTAGHCVSQNNLFTAVCGSNTITPSSTEVRVKVVKQIIHPSNLYLQNDVALFKLERDLDLSPPTLGSVCLPDPNESLDFLAGKYAIATGWGNTEKEARPNKLKKVSLKVWKQADCVKAWEKNDYNIKITDGNICIGQGDKSTCHGDSGGPLVHFNEATKRWTTYGVTSFGNSSCIGPIPPVDARLSVYAKWVWDTVAANSN